MPVDFQRMVEDLKGAEHDLGMLRARVHSALNAPTGGERQDHYFEADSSYASHPGTAAMSARVGQPPSLGRSYPSPCLCALFCVTLFVGAGCVASISSMPNTATVWTSTPAPKRSKRSHVDAPVVTLGLWDSTARISTLQLTVVAALAWGVDEQHVRVTSVGNSFFVVRVLQEGEYLFRAFHEGTEFLDSLNLHAARFAARLVVTHEAALEQNITGS